MRLAIGILVAILWAGVGLQADETPPAPSAVEQVGIGRVFMSPAERRELDRLRKLEPEPVTGPGAESVTPGTSDVPAGKRSQGAGYIVPSSGLPYTWADGDFRRTTDGNIDIGKLPGAVSIIRHQGENVPVKAPDKEAEKVTDRETVSVPESGNDGTD